MKNFFHSLKFKITVANSIVMCILVCLVSLIWQKTYYDNISQSIQSNVSYIIESANGRIEDSLKTVEYNVVSLLFDDYFMEIVKNQGEFRSDQQKWEDKKYMLGKLAPYMSLNKHIDHITVSTKNGMFYSPTSVYTRERERFSRYLEEYQEENITYLVASKKTASYVDNDKEATNLTMIRPICYVGETIGQIVVDIDLSGLMEQYKALDKFDMVLICYDIRNEKPVFINGLHNYEKIREIIDPYLTGEEKTEDYVVKKIGDDEIFLKNFKIDSYEWKILAAVSQEGFLKKYADSVKTNLVLINTSIVFIFAAVYQIVRLSTRNIDKLTRAIEEIEGDSLDLDLEIDADDEAGLLCSVFQKMLERIRAQMSLIREKEKEKQQLQFQALQAQMNPHFLYNSLNTIKFLARMQGSSNVEEVTDALSGLLQVTMHSAQYITLKQEKKFLQDYICMQEYKYGREVNLEIHIEKEVENAYIPKLMLQPLAENSIKHGQILEGENAKIVILAYGLKGKLYIKMRDNGIGIEEGRLKELNQNLGDDTGIGLYNLQQRIYLTYGKGAEMHFDSYKGKGFVVEIVIPLQMKQPE